MWSKPSRPTTNTCIDAAKTSQRGLRRLREMVPHSRGHQKSNAPEAIFGSQGEVQHEASRFDAIAVLEVR